MAKSRKSPRTATRTRSRTKPTGNGRPTIRAVAVRARVAVSTVSRVLNGGYASEAVKGRVQRAIRELAYAPSDTARSLVRGRTGSVGIVTHSRQSPWVSAVLAGMEATLARSRYSVLLGSLFLERTYDSSTVSTWIRERRVDGLVFARYTRRERKLCDAAAAAGLPVVLLAPDVLHPAGFVVRCDNVRAGWLVAAHLASLGHRRIAYAAGPRDSLDSRDRLRGLRTELSRRGVRLAATDVWQGGDYEYTGGAEFAARYLKLPKRARPTAVVAGNDAMALAFMRAVLQRGINIPEDLSVVGFDDISDAALYWPGLTTVHQPAYEMGSAACRVLLERLAGRDPDLESPIEYDVDLVVRESTASPPARRRSRKS